jgi:hypothetical protein
VSDLLLSLWEEGWEPMTPIDMAAKAMENICYGKLISF